jgi:hypothetical protein
MEQKPSWEAHRFAASQEIPRIHKCSPPVRILSQLNPFHTPTYPFLRCMIIMWHKILSEIIQFLFWGILFGKNLDGSQQKVFRKDEVE